MLVFWLENSIGERCGGVGCLTLLFKINNNLIIEIVHASYHVCVCASLCAGLVRNFVYGNFFLSSNLNYVAVLCRRIQAATIAVPQYHCKIKWDIEFGLHLFVFFLFRRKKCD